MCQMHFGTRGLAAMPFLWVGLDALVTGSSWGTPRMEQFRVLAAACFLTGESFLAALGGEGSEGNARGQG